MPIFAVMLDEENPEAWENVRSNWPAPHHHILDTRVAYVKDDTKLTAEVADTVGIGKDIPGMVIQADYKYGFTSASLVEWLEKQS